MWIVKRKIENKRNLFLNKAITKPKDRTFDFDNYSLFCPWVLDDLSAFDLSVDELSLSQWLYVSLKLDIDPSIIYLGKT